MAALLISLLRADTGLIRHPSTTGTFVSPIKYITYDSELIDTWFKEGDSSSIAEQIRASLLSFSF